MTRTRFAPSLTGYLHLGHVLHMIYLWGTARREGAEVLCRIEDHDIGRARPEYESAILETIGWLGFVPDLGLSSIPPIGGTTSVSSSGRARARPSNFRQSDCADHYAAVLEQLKQRGLVYGCACSRKEIRENRGTPASASADSVAAAPLELHYPGTCADRGLPLEGNTVRFRVSDGEAVFDDLNLGEQRQVPKHQCGDFSLRDRQGNWTYQFCCVCDDIEQGIDGVIRGEDLLPSTGRQIQLFRALGHEPPQYLHHPLLLDETGEKLSKRQRSEGISALREKGSSPEQIIGRAAFLGGLLDQENELSADEAITLLSQWSNI